MRKQDLVCAAQARAIIVFPVPGGPYSSTPLGGLMPRASNRSCPRHPKVTLRRKHRDREELEIDRDVYRERRRGRAPCG